LEADPGKLTKRRAARKKNQKAFRDRNRNRELAPGNLNKLQLLTPEQRASFRDTQTRSAYGEREAKALKALRKLLKRRGLFFVCCGTKNSCALPNHKFFGTQRTINGKAVEVGKE
jgi:hypothetical protein